jgi:hypothetical protein
MKTWTVLERTMTHNYETLLLVRWDSYTGKNWEVIRQTSTGGLRYGRFDNKADALECFEQIVESEEDDE